MRETFWREDNRQLYRYLSHHIIVTSTALNYHRDSFDIVIVMLKGER